MKIVLDKIQADGQGSFFVQDEVTSFNYFHFVTQIADKDTLKITFQKHLDETMQQEENRLKVEAEIQAIINGV